MRPPIQQPEWDCAGLLMLSPEHGVAMLSSVLNSHRAVQMSILIVRTFVKLRQVLATHKDLAQKIEKLARVFPVQSLRRLYLEYDTVCDNEIGLVAGNRSSLVIDLSGNLAANIVAHARADRPVHVKAEEAATHAIAGRKARRKSRSRS